MTPHTFWSSFSSHWKRCDAHFGLVSPRDRAQRSGNVRFWAGLLGFYPHISYISTYWLREFECMHTQFNFKSVDLFFQRFQWLGRFVLNSELCLCTDHWQCYHSIGLLKPSILLVAWRCQMLKIKSFLLQIPQCFWQKHTTSFPQIWNAT